VASVDILSKACDIAGIANSSSAVLALLNVIPLFLRRCDYRRAVLITAAKRWRDVGPHGWGRKLAIRGRCDFCRFEGPQTTPAKNRRVPDPTTARRATRTRSRSTEICRPGTRLRAANDFDLNGFATRDDHPQRGIFQLWAVPTVRPPKWRSNFKTRGCVRRQWDPSEAVSLWPMAMLRVSLTSNRSACRGRPELVAGLRRCRLEPAFGRDRVGGITASAGRSA